VLARQPHQYKKTAAQPQVRLPAITATIISLISASVVSS